MTAIVPLTELAFDEAKALFVEIRDSAEHVWILLMRARDHKAWKAVGYSSWDECVKNEFQMSKRYANQLINYGQLQAVLMDKAEVGAIAPTLPGNEAQARELRGLEPELAREVLKAAKDAAAETGKPVTAAHVKAAVRAKRNGTAAAEEHAPAVPLEQALNEPTSIAENPVWQIDFNAEHATPEQLEEAISHLSGRLQPRKKLLIVVRLYQELPEEERQQFNRLLEAAK